MDLPIAAREWNLSILGTMEAAIRRGIPVVMFGQGMGPLSDPIVLSRAKDVLPEVTLITLRGSRGGLALLESIGVSSARVLTTGDEAIELAYAARAKATGQRGRNQPAGCILCRREIGYRR